MDYYEVLQVSTEATQDDIRKAYQQLVLRHHPDKSTEQEINLHIFLKISEAWNTLKDPLTRKDYDSKQFQDSTSQMIIHDTVERNDFLFDESNKVHYYVCKCGGRILDEESSDEKEYIICCDECSLVIKVINNKGSD